MASLVNKITTDRIIIRQPKIEDAPIINLAQNRSFESLNPWMEWAKTMPSIENTMDFVNFSIEKWKENNPSNLPFVIVEKDSDEFVGGIGYVSIDWDVPSFEIGYWRDIKHAHKGYILESANALSRFAFKQFKANRVQICCDADNLLSKRVPERLNFKLEARLKNHRIKPATGEVSDTLVYAILENDLLPPLNFKWT